VKKLLAALFLILFSFQIAVKTGVVAYYSLFNNNVAEKNCVYKTITICKGNCYVVKQIKLVSSETTTNNKEVKGDFDLNKIQDVVFEFESINLSSITKESLHFYPSMSFQYSLITYSNLLKPPVA